MDEPIDRALKEWAVICRALVTGRQSILIRKGGIAEPTGDFQLEAKCFWLFPTYVHQQEQGVRPEAQELLDAANRERPAAGIVRIDSWAEVTGIYQVRDLLPAQMLAHLHIWTDEAIDKRFHYRSPGVNVLSVRVHRAAAAFEIADLPSYAGCKSWVPLERKLSTAGSTPVLSDAEYRDVIVQLDTLLRPTAIV
jgi:hypothetical protein